MTDKDMNMAILGKLYEIADSVWERVTKIATGSFTASEVYKNRYGDFWLDSQDENRDWEVSVGTFSCTFPTWHVFRLVAAFENLARVGSKKRLFKAEEQGTEPGDVLTFVDGTEVVAGDNTTVWYDGEEYTLSGFCRKFMPDEKRHKANSYRGCVFFYRDGVKLEKLYKDARKAVSVDVVDNAEHVGEVKASVPTTVEKPDIAQPVVSVACAMQPLAVLAPGFALPSVARETEVVHRHAVRHVSCRVGAPGIGIGRAYVTGRRSTACHKVAHTLPRPP